MGHFLIAQEVSGLFGPAVQTAESRKDTEVVSTAAFSFHEWKMKIWGPPLFDGEFLAGPRCLLAPRLPRPGTHRKLRSILPDAKRTYP